MLLEGSWASRLSEASHRLTSVSYVSAVMPGHRQVLAWISRMFTRFSDQRLPRVRAWVDGGQRYTITDEVIRLAAQPDLELPERLALAAGAERYCVTFNGLSAWCPEFAHQLQQQMLEPLFAALDGEPAAGCDFYAFFGRYGYTPFGVHDDNDHSLLWHLGPNPKVAYVWPRAHYQALTGGTLATLKYEALLPRAQRFELQPGDLLFIPKGDFHVLDTPEFSVTMGLTLFPGDVVLECAEGLRMLAPDAATVDKIGQQALTLAQLGQLRRRALRSNGYVTASPQLSLLQVASLDEAALQTAQLSAWPGWPLQTIAMAGREGLLVRGRALWSNSQGLFPALAESLNRPEGLSFSALAAQLTGRVKPEALTEVLRQINRLGGLHVEGR